MAAIARQIALSVLNSLDDPHVTLDSLLVQAFKKRPRLIQPDRALANELVFGVLRWRARLDWVIKDLSNTPIDRIDPPVLNIIRLGLYQILFLSRIPVSAAVNDSVELAKDCAPPWTVRFVNAVLRNAVRLAQDIPLPGEKDDPVSAIAIGESHPPWMVKRWVKHLGVEETKRLCKTNNQIPPVTIRANTLKVSREKLHRSLVAHVRGMRQTRFAPEGLALTGLKQPIGKMSPFQKGWFQVQDEAAQLITYLLDPKEGETILDACAGLGGKTGHIAQLMKNSGVLRAMDREAWKLRSLRTATKRLGISTVTTWHRDLSSPVADNFASTFDRILVDAPCSGLGVIRRNPDIKWKKREEDLLRLQRRQGRLLATLAPLVKRGGWLVYCVCSLEPEEGDRVVDAFLKSHSDFAITRSPCTLSEMNEHFVDTSGIFRTAQNQHNMDGFFAVRLKKVGP
ncbi:MAG: 16S rRNA (cytosine(967)-C(5))-methyltransferase RsmB [Thermodesulfobacteriota bacterium]|nr:16S rRNA (cytosine(967)-C(5))-methyltransferase RsmB [Thermodesulfobacteriota bacterium]